MLIPSLLLEWNETWTSLSRRVNANSQLLQRLHALPGKLIKKGEC